MLKMGSATGASNQSVAHFSIVRFLPTANSWLLFGTIARRGDLKLSELAAIEGINPTLLSRIVAKLEADQLVKRTPDAEDRRVAHVVPTAKGRRRYEQIRNARTDALSLAIAGLTDAERRRAGRRAAGARVARGDASGRPPVIMDATVRRTFSALRIPNYRRYFTGQAISLIGTWMQTTAQVWLVLQLTGSATDLGFVVALQTLPVLLLGPYGGLVADRIDKRRLMVGAAVADGSAGARPRRS